MVFETMVHMPIWLSIALSPMVLDSIGVVDAQAGDRGIDEFAALLNSTEHVPTDASNAYKQLWAPGHALSFDGEDDYFHFQATTDSSLPDLLFEEATFSCWYQHVGKSNSREALMGFGQEEGPSMHMIKSASGKHIEIVPVSSWDFAENNNCSVYTSHVPDDVEWHHVVLSYSLTSLLIVTDGKVAYECTSDTPIPNQWESYDREVGSSKAFLVGRYAGPSHGPVRTPREENSMPLYGLMDDVRVYQRALDLAEIRQIYHSAPDQPLKDLMVWFDFANGGPLVEKRYSSIDISVNTGGGYKRFTPLFVESRAPLYTFNNWQGNRNDSGLNIAPTFYRQKQLRHDADKSVVVIAPVFDRLTLMKGQELVKEKNMTKDQYDVFPIQTVWQYLLISNATIIDGNGTSSSVNNEAGVIGLFNGSVIPLSALPIVINQTSVVFAPASGYFGTVTIRVQRTSVMSLTPAKNETTDYMNMQMDIVENWAPQAGSAGYAIQCDGFNDYMYAPYFKWPVGNYTSPHDNITRFGGGPITVEGWVYVIKDHVSDSAIWSIGSGEQAKWTTDSRNPNKKTGRLYFAMPSPARPQQFRWDVGSLSRTSGSMASLGGTWVHFAVVHTQVSGTSALVYLNGQLWSNTTHNHTGVGTLNDSNESDQAPNQSRVEGFSVCTWMFWSGVFHKGAVDEIRIWNYTKTQEEIKRDMYISLVSEVTETLREPMPNLMGYWTFDEIDPGFAYDYSGHNNHLRAAGCAVCDNGLDDEGFNNTYYQGYNATSKSTVCQPIAQSDVSDWYTDAPVYGGAYCYYTNAFNISVLKQAFQHGLRDNDRDHIFLPGVETEKMTDKVADIPYQFIWSILTQNENPAAVPPRVISGAPLGTHLFPQIVLSNVLVVTLNGTDREDGALIYRINKLLSIGNMTFFDEQGIEQPVVQNVDLPQGVRTVTITMDADVGGGPFYFEYQVFDTWLLSDPAVVSVYSNCGGGQYVDQETSSCKPCPAGQYSNINSLREFCTPCPKHMAQDMTGQTQCLPCQYSTYSHDVGATFCKDCVDREDNMNLIHERNDTHPLTLQSDGACEMHVEFPSTNSGVVLRMLPSLNLLDVEHLPDKVTLALSRAEEEMEDDEWISDFDFNRNYDIMEYVAEDWTLSLTNYPRTGHIYQVEELPDGSVQKVGDPLLEIINTPAILYSSYVTNILNPLDAYDNGNWSNALGLPDLVYFKPFKYTSSNVIVDVQFSELLYPNRIDLFMKPLSAHIVNVQIPISGQYSHYKRRESIINAFDENWKNIWNGVQPAPDADNKVTITMCPVVIKSNMLRLVFESTSKPTESSFGGVGVHLDAVRIMGTRELLQRPGATITDPLWRVYYQPMQGPNTNTSVTFNFIATPCDIGSAQELPVSLMSAVMPSPGTLSTGIIVGCGLLVGLSELLVVSGLIAVIVLRNTPRLRRASPLFIGIMLLGALIGLPAPLIAYLEIESVAGCMAGVCMWSFGFILTFGSLFIKTYRVRMIFRSSVKKLHQGINCSDRELLTKLSLLLLLNALFLALYFGLSDYHLVTMVIADEVWLLCPQSWGLLVLIIFQAIVMVLGAVLAYQVRKVPSDFKESAFIGLSIYNWLFVSIIALPTLLLTPGDGNTDMMILCVYMVLIFMVTLWFLVGYKLLLLYKERNKPSVDNTSKSESTHPVNHESTISRDQLSSAQSQLGKGAGVLHTPHIASSSDAGGSTNFSSMMFTSAGGALLAMPKKDPNRDTNRIASSSTSQVNATASATRSNNGVRAVRNNNSLPCTSPAGGGLGAPTRLGHSNLRPLSPDRNGHKTPNNILGTVDDCDVADDGTKKASEVYDEGPLLPDGDKAVLDSDPSSLDVEYYNSSELNMLEVLDGRISP